MFMQTGLSKKQKSLLLGASALVILAAALYFFVYPPIHHSGDQWTFTGKITNQVSNCGVDGECSITVRGRKVFTGCGLSAMPIDVCPAKRVPVTLSHEAYAYRPLITEVFLFAMISL
jgi:hypothetical protein